MANTSDHESNFRTEFSKRYGTSVLAGKKRFIELGNLNRQEAVETSVDESFELDGWMVLVEVDSFNVAKPAVGQYFLLNNLIMSGRNKTIFLVINHYSDFNEQRTMKYLRYTATQVRIQDPIRYLAMTKEQFWSLCDTSPSLESLVQALIIRCGPTDPNGTAA